MWDLNGDIGKVMKTGSEIRDHASGQGCPGVWCNASSKLGGGCCDAQENMLGFANNIYVEQKPGARI